MDWLAHFFADIKITDVLLALFTGLLWWSTDKLWGETKRLAEGADDQSSKMAASIAESARAALAMENVATSMATSVSTGREIADRQKLVTELQSRGYLSVQFMGIVPQDNAKAYRFEPRVLLVNNGLTPAYQVRFRAAADVLPVPLSPDFNFPLPAWDAGGSVSVVGPRQQKIISARVPKLYADIEIEQIKSADGQRLHMWGEATYKDAFGIHRFVKFSMMFVWLFDGSTYAFDTKEHNDAD